MQTKPLRNKYMIQHDITIWCHHDVMGHLMLICIWLKYAFPQKTSIDFQQPIGIEVPTQGIHDHSCDLLSSNRNVHWLMNPVMWLQSAHWKCVQADEKFHVTFAIHGDVCWLMKVVILRVSGVLTTNKREETAEGKEQHREERDLKEVHGWVSPTRVSHPVIFSPSAVCPLHDISALCSGTCHPWASLNQQHWWSHPSKPCSSIHMVSHSAPYSMANYLNKFPTPSPLLGPAGIIETIWHPHRIGPEKPVIVAPVTTSFIAPKIWTIANQHHHEWLTGVYTKVPVMAPLGCITPLCNSSALILDIITFPYTISSHFLSLFGLLQALPCGGALVLGGSACEETVQVLGHVWHCSKSSIACL